METKFGYPQVLVQVKVFEESKILNLLDRVLGENINDIKNKVSLLGSVPFVIIINLNLK